MLAYKDQKEDVNKGKDFQNAINVQQKHPVNVHATFGIPLSGESALRRNMRTEMKKNNAEKEKRNEIKTKSEAHQLPNNIKSVCSVTKKN